MDLSANLMFAWDPKFRKAISDIPTTSTIGVDSMPNKITGEDLNYSDTDDSTSSDESLESTPPNTSKKYKRILRPLNENDSPELPGE